MDIKEIIKQTAESYIGQEEIRGNVGFKDKEFERKIKVCGFKVGQAWCSYFAELVWRSAYQNYNATIVPKINVLFNSSAVRTFANFKRTNDFLVREIPTVGALVVWQNYKNGEAHWTGHIGIVAKVNKLNNQIITIEGNTNDNGGREGYKVASKVRNIDFSKKDNGLVLLGFVHPKI